MIRIIREETVIYGIDITREEAVELMQQAIDYDAVWLAHEGIRSADDLAGKSDDELASLLESAANFGQVDLYSGLTDEGNSDWEEVLSNSYTVLG